MKGYTIQHSIDLLEKTGGKIESINAEQVSYDNTSSHMTADDVQDAIDELNTMIAGVSSQSDISGTEHVVGKWFNEDRYSKTVTLGVLPNNNTVSVEHGIENLGQFTRISGIAVASTGAAIPLPYVDDTSKNGDVLLDVNSTNVRVITKADKSVFTGYVTLEYTKVAPVTNTRSRKKKEE